MKTLNAIGFNLIIFSITDSWTIKTFGIIFLLISFLVDLYILGSEQENIN